MIPNIPEKLLIHSAELITGFDDDIWGSPTETEIRSLKNIRIDHSSKTVSDGSGTSLKLSAVLFFDCKNSIPHDTVFALKGDIVNGRKTVFQQVRSDGKIFTVISVEPFYSDTNKIHHYEIGLI